MPGYNHLDRSERDQIAELRAQGLGATAIAEVIGRDKSTVSRELGRNAHGDGTYRPVLPKVHICSAANARPSLKPTWACAASSLTGWPKAGRQSRSPAGSAAGSRSACGPSAPRRSTRSSSDRRRGPRSSGATSPGARPAAAGAPAGRGIGSQEKLIYTQRDLAAAWASWAAERLGLEGHQNGAIFAPVRHEAAVSV